MYRTHLQEIAMEQPVNAVSRVSNLPVVQSAINQVVDVYAQAKEKNQYLKSTLEVAENTVSAVATSAKPVMEKLEKPMNVANSMANKGLDKLEETVPIIKKPTEEVMQETGKLYESTLKPSVDKVVGAATYSKDTFNMGMEKVTAAKEYGMTKLNDAKDYGNSKASDAKSFGWQKMNDALETSYGQAVINSVETLLTTTEQYVDYYLPEPQPLGPDNQQAGATPTGKEDEKNSQIERVSKLSTKVRRRMYVRAVRGMLELQARSKENLDKLHLTVDLIQLAKDNVDTMNEKMHAAQVHVQQTWAELTTTATTDGDMSDEGKSLFVLRNLSSQLHKACNDAYTTSVSLLPANLQTSMDNAKIYVDDLYQSFSKAEGYDDLPAQVLQRSKDGIAYLQRVLLNIADTVISSKALSWMIPDVNVDKINLEEEESDNSDAAENSYVESN